MCRHACIVFQLVAPPLAVTFKWYDASEIISIVRKDYLQHLNHPMASYVGTSSCHRGVLGFTHSLPGPNDAHAWVV